MKNRHIVKRLPVCLYLPVIVMFLVLPAAVQGQADLWVVDYRWHGPRRLDAPFTHLATFDVRPSGGEVSLPSLTYRLRIQPVARCTILADIGIPLLWSHLRHVLVAVDVVAFGSLSTCVRPAGRLLSFPSLQSLLNGRERASQLLAEVGKPLHPGFTDGTVRAAASL